MIVLLALLACGGGEPDDDVAPEETGITETGDPDPDPDPGTLTLEQFGVTGWDGSELTYVDGVVPYDLSVPLFSDYAVKRRALWLPDGEPMGYTGEDRVLEFPVGSVLLKSFLFPADLRSPDQDLRLIETRVLVNTDEGWKAEPFLWSEDGSEATYAPSGAAMPIEVIGLDGEPLTVQYLVPQRNQCVDCHELNDGDDKYFTPIGPKARHLNRDYDYGSGPVNQLQHWADNNQLVGLPALDAVPSAVDFRALEGTDPRTLPFETVEAATRDYLDINCAHCHNPNGTEGISSQLFLHRGATDPFDLGVCKRPGSAGEGNGGLTFDIVPGDHTQSILWFRVHTEEVGAMMPDIGRSVRHDAGADFIAAWIDGLEGSCDP